VSDAFSYGLAFFLPLAAALFISVWLVRIWMWIFRTFGLDRV